MAKKKANYTNTKHGLLKVISCVEQSNGHNQGGSWLCMCKCKRMITLSGYRLHSRKSCGCLGRKAAIERGKALRKSVEEKALNTAYRQYKKECKSQQIECLSRDIWDDMIKKSCWLCGEKHPLMRKVICIGESQEVLCGKCGWIKSFGDLTGIEVMKYVEKIHENLSKNKPDNNNC